MKRSIADYIAIKKRDYSLHLQYDENFCIKPTTFNTANDEMEYETSKFVRDITEEGHPVYKKQVITSVGFRRKNYLMSSNDLFDTVRKLPNQAYILFRYIIDNIDYDNNYIILSTQDIKNILNTKYQSVASKAINDLIYEDIIRKCKDTNEKNCYVINHQNFFKGNFTNFIISHNKIYGVISKEEEEKNAKRNNRKDADDRRNGNTESTDSASDTR